MKFSERYGYTSIRETMQFESIDERLRNRLWNDITIFYFNKLSRDPNANVDNIFAYIWVEFFIKRMDDLDGYSIEGYVKKYLKEWFYKESDWYDKLNFIEFLLKESLNIIDNFISRINISLEKEMSAYRIVDKKIVQITDKTEINEIEGAINISSSDKNVQMHLKTALGYLSDRNNPDYRNSIKESISAIESYSKIITGDDKIKFGKAIKNIEMHPSLREAFSKLYGWTSDESGIRHSFKINGYEIKFEEAKYMLVSCSAFINYLKIKHAK
ncbi:MAG: hypothetical protein GXO80_10240 [Chlorobi bacterium]|nr:hypothetical protein [Chlorobiota bacterium]